MIDMLVIIKIQTPDLFTSFKRCFESYHKQLVNQDVRYIICDDSPDGWKEEVSKYLDGFKLNCQYIENPFKGKRNGFYMAVSELIRAATSKYCMFLLDDVELMGNDVFTPSLTVLEGNDNIVQVKVGGGHINDGITHFNKYPQTKTKFKDIIVGQDKVYTAPLDDELYSEEPFILGYWNSILRTSDFQRYDEVLRDFTGGRRSITFHDYHENSCRHTRPQLKEQFYGKEFGWLNWKDYLYLWGAGGRREFKHWTIDYRRSLLDE